MVLDFIFIIRAKVNCMAGEANWYVVHTYSGYENKVKVDIEKTIEKPESSGSDPGSIRSHAVRSQEIKTAWRGC